MPNYENVLDEIKDLFEKGKSSTQIADELEQKYDEPYSSRQIRKKIGKMGLRKDNTFTKTLADNNFEFPENFEYGWLKTKEASVFIKNSKGIVSFDEMREDFLKDMKKHSPSHAKIKRQKNDDPHALVIDIADLHIGKLGDSFETGDEYNAEIAVERAIEGVSGILSKSQGFNIDQIIFVIGNDILHTDNSTKTTTGGTGQDVSGMWYSNYRIARQLYIGIIEQLVNIADVHVVHNPSNHDYVTGFMLADSVFCWFNKHKNITFDISMAHRKYYQYGNNLIGTSHGDGGKMDTMPLVMANEAKVMWAETEWRYIYLHHIHHKDYFKFRSGKDYHGVSVEYLRSPSGSDSWHHKQQYQHSPKAVEAFIHHKDFGQVARITHLFS